MLATADQYGVVDKHPRAIAEETGLSREAVDAAILNLESPDIESRSPEHNGRRIIRMDEHRAWGWSIVNYGKYRAIRNEEDRREANRLAQERFRNKSNNSKPQSAKVSRGKPPSSQAEAEAEALSSKPLSVLSEADELASSVERVWNYYVKKFGRKSTYTFTDHRKAKGLARMVDCMKLTGGDKEQAAQFMKQAVDALYGSDFHRTGGFIDWVDNLFKSTEQLQKWLDPQKTKNGEPSNMKSWDEIKRQRDND